MKALVIGTGYAGTRHGEALRELGIDLVGPVSAREAVQGRTAIPRDIDVVHVCAANDLHYPLASAALRAGKHVICEKPLTLDVPTAETLTRQAEGTSPRAFVAYNYRFYPAIRDLAARLARAEIGDIRMVRVSFLQEWLLDPPDALWRYDPGTGAVSRIVADLGSHCVDLVEFVTGRTVASISAEVGEHHASALLDVSGVTCAMTISQVAAGHANDVEVAVDGSRGSAQWTFTERDDLRILTPDGPMKHSFAAAGANGARRDLISAAYRAIDGEDVVVPTFRDGLRHVRLAAAALESQRERKWVQV